VGSGKAGSLLVALQPGLCPRESARHRSCWSQTHRRVKMEGWRGLGWLAGCAARAGVA
jgi:hypothetical protein